MSTQPKALFLADFLESNDASIEVQNAAASELRRLHKELEICRATSAEVAKQAYHKGHSAGIYAARNALNEMFSL